MRAERNAAADLLKAVAVLGVIALHGLTTGELRDAWEGLHFGQAVPFFAVLMAVHAADSFRRRGVPQRLADARAYLARRGERLLVPFAVVWLASLAVGAVHGGLDFGPTTAVGVTPLSGPGNYFVTIAFEFVLVAPFLYWAFRRAPVATIAGCFALSAAFELVAPHVFSGVYPYTYDAALPRYLGQVGLGLWIAGHPRLRDNRWLLALAVASLAYLVWEHESPGGVDWLRNDFGMTTNFLAAPYGAALVLLGLHALPRLPLVPPLRALAALGRASWEVFLVQMVWFAVVDDRGIDAFALNVLGPCVISYALHVLVNRARPSRRRPDRLADQCSSSPTTREAEPERASSATAG